MAASTRRLILGALAGTALLAGTIAAQAADKVTLRTNWLFYGSHSIFLLGIDKGFYEKEGIDLTVKQGNGSGNAVRLVANGDTDFAYELPVAQMNRHLSGVETVFLPGDPRFGHVSSSLIKEVAALGGDIAGLVPDEVRAALLARIQTQERSADL